MHTYRGRREEMYSQCQLACCKGTQEIAAVLRSILLIAYGGKNTLSSFMVEVFFKGFALQTSNYCINSISQL